MEDQDALVQFKLMIPSRLKDAIANVAQAKRRSLSQEIVSALEEKYPVAPDGTTIVMALEDIYHALMGHPGGDWRDCIGHFADQYRLPADAFGATRSDGFVNLTYSTGVGRGFSLSDELPLEDPIAGELAKVENLRDEAQLAQLAKLNRTLAAGMGTAQFEAVIDPDGTSPRLSGKTVVLRLKP